MGIGPKWLLAFEKQKEKVHRDSVLERKPRKKRNSIVRNVCVCACVRASVQRYNMSILVRSSAMIESNCLFFVGHFSE